MHNYFGADVKERLARLKAVQKLLKNEKIMSQNTLLDYLQKEGFEVTQATLSRDLKVLEVGKISDGKGGYVYSLPGETGGQEAGNDYIQDLLKNIVSIDWSGNIVIIKTYSGHTDPVSLALDNLGFNEILGTIAGRDDTVAVFLKEGIRGEAFMQRMKEKIPELGKQEKWRSK